MLPRSPPSRRGRGHGLGLLLALYQCQLRARELADANQCIHLCLQPHTVRPQLPVRLRLGLGLRAGV